MTNSPALTLRSSGSIVRHHIVFIAVVATVIFGWLGTDRYWVGVALLAGVDWFFINLVNRITDVPEDTVNRVAGSSWVAVHQRPLRWATGIAWPASLFVHVAMYPDVLSLRLLVIWIGLAYSFRWVPTSRGMRRFKDLYFFKNFMSAMLFVLTCFAYPLAANRWHVGDLGWRGVGALTLFFVAFELTYEILYDLRDLEGDRREGVPTYPVVHGPARARQIIDGLLGTSAAVLVVSLLGGVIGLREGLMLAAPGVQWLFYRPRLARGLSGEDCVWLTHLGTGLLVFYLLGTALWAMAGLPQNVWLT